jgi:2,3-dihydroxybiphenyl 1,2-dioxygenase
MVTEGNERGLPMSSVIGLGYLGLDVDKPEDWLAFATRVLGMEARPPAADGAIPLRYDDHEQRIRLHRGKSDDIAYLGLEVAEEAALAEVVRRLEAAGTAVRAGSPEELNGRGVEVLAVFEDPNRIRCELFCRPQRERTPFQSPVMPSGFVTGDEGMGHVLLFVDNGEKCETFYRDLLGLKLTDYVDIELGGTPVHAVFLHSNPRHHSLAFAQARSPRRLHHFMLEVNALDDLGATFDRCQDAGVPILYTLGRHQNDRMISFYGVTPSAFAFEIGWGARKVDDADWQVRTYYGISDWGHRPPSEAAPRQ